MSLHNLNFNVTIDFNFSQFRFPEEATLRRHLVATPLRFMLDPEFIWIFNSYLF